MSLYKKSTHYGVYKGVLNLKLFDMMQCNRWSLPLKYFDGFCFADSTKNLVFEQKCLIFPISFVYFFAPKKLHKIEE